jgi:hypothetical protein
MNNIQVWVKESECRDTNGETAVIYNPQTQERKCIMIGKSHMYAFNREVDETPIGGTINVELN